MKAILNQSVRGGFKTIRKSESRGCKRNSNRALLYNLILFEMVHPFRLLGNKGLMYPNQDAAIMLETSRRA
jgi:hypothetical protein